MIYIPKKLGTLGKQETLSIIPNSFLGGHPKRCIQAAMSASRYKCLLFCAQPKCRTRNWGIHYVRALWYVGVSGQRLQNIWAELNLLDTTKHNLFCFILHYACTHCAGSIPNELGNLENLERLIFGGNKLTDSVIMCCYRCLAHMGSSVRVHQNGY